MVTRSSDRIGELKASLETLEDSRALSGQLLTQIHWTRAMLHDIGSPISSIILYSELLLEQQAESSIQARVGRIRDAAQKCQQMVQQLAAIVQGSPPVAAPLHVADLCAAALAWLQPRLAADNMRLVLQVSPDLPPAIGDHGIMLRTLLTLLRLAHQAARANATDRYLALQAESNPAADLPGGRARAVRLTVQVARPAGGPDSASPQFDASPAALEVGDDDLEWLGAVAAAESLGGRLRAESPAVGSGLAFILDIPAG